jgi:hypothetical protein
MFNFSMFEKTGQLGSQPTMYFLSRELQNDTNSIKHLYNKGYLFHIIIKTNIENESYFLPFDLRKVNRIDIFPILFFWQKMINERNSEIKKMVEGRR